MGCRLNLQDEAGCKDTKCNSNCPVGDDDTARVLYKVACVCFLVALSCKEEEQEGVVNALPFLGRLLVFHRSAPGTSTAWLC